MPGRTGSGSISVFARDLHTPRSLIEASRRIFVGRVVGRFAYKENCRQDAGARIQDVVILRT